jgi:mono/diheme cytochrome c family protein
MRPLLALILLMGAAPAAIPAAAQNAAQTATQTGPDFTAVGALFAERCVMCHSGSDAPLGLHLDSYAATLKGSENGPVLIAGDLSSPLLQRLRGQAQPQMPLDGPPFLSDAEITLVADWVTAGLPEGSATFTALPERTRPAPGADVLWSDVEPIFLKVCAKCHSDNSIVGGPPEGLRLDSWEHALAADERVAVVPGNPEMSEIWRRITGLSDPRMPHDGPPWLPDDDIRLIRDWIAQGARAADGTRAPMPVGARVRLRGILTAEAEIDGAAFIIDGSTRVDDLPAIGEKAEMRGEVQADGSVIATRFRDR